MTGSSRGHEGDLARFVALHEPRLVSSLLAETPLSPDRATAIVRDVVTAAWERGLTAETGPLLYGWLRVAARRRALDELRGTTSNDAAGAADAAFAGLAGAQRALAGLPQSEREVLKLRYAEGLLPDAIAARLGTTTAAVETSLERARRAVARELRRNGTHGHAAAILAGWRERAGAAVRPAAAAAIVAVAAFVAVPQQQGPGHAATVPPALAAPGAGELVVVDVAETGHGAVRRTPSQAATTAARVLAAATSRPGAPVDAPDTDTPQRPPVDPPSLCETLTAVCLGGSQGDKVRIPLPGDNPSGSSEVVVSQDAIPVCAAVNDVMVARCDRGGT